MAVKQDSRSVRLESAHALSANRLLKNLDVREVEGLLESARWTRFGQGDLIARQGEAVEAVLFLAEGSAVAQVASPNHGPLSTVLNELRPGDDVGLLSLLDGRPHFASVVALEPVRAVSIPMAAMQAMLARRDEWSFWSAVFGPANNGPAPTREHLLVLLIDDDLVGRKLMNRLLEKAGHTVVSISDVDAAVAAWRREPYDLVLLDVPTLQTKNLEVAAAIRAKERRSGGHIPIVAVTGAAVRDAERACLTAGVDRCGPKPLTARDLKVAIKHALAATAASPAAVA